ncbi:hypothetical protein GCM10023350_31430 [Nocardioides endophyticus]|uniref:Uncharacterized protein n=1 Tax=Nocardioides endophyticus TaxID=1353775 RepID=A0ABP8Z262_9ACTN
MAPTVRDQDWSERHGDAIREAAPAVPDLTEGEKIALWQRIEASDTHRARRRTHWKAVVAGLVAVGLVGVAGAATGNVFSAHTGRGPVDAEDVELGGPGERLDPRAPDFAGVMDEMTTDIRFPSVAARDSALDWELDNATRDRSDITSLSSGALRLWTAGHALCSWSNVWAGALRTGDIATEQRAADVILGARTWPSITDTDPDMADESEFAWLPDLEQAIRTDDPAAARTALAGNQSCMPGLAPELRLGKRR